MKLQEHLAAVGGLIRGWLPGGNLAAGSAYREGMWISTWGLLVLAVPLGILTTLAVVQAFTGVPLGNHPGPTIFLFAIDALIILLFLAFFPRLTVRIDPSKVRLRLGVVAKEVSMEDVVNAAVENAMLRTYGGIGIRYGTDGSMAFLSSLGTAVKLTRRNGKPILFSTRRAPEVSQLVNSWSKRSGP
jgi:hypothetical protein